jgi:hypothetical protein
MLKVRWLIIGLFWVKNVVSTRVKSSAVTQLWMKRRKLKETCRLHEIILTENINQIHRNGILLVYDICCDITHVFTWLVLWNYFLFWLCRGLLILKWKVIKCWLYAYVIASHEPSTIHDALLRVNIVSLISPDIPSPSHIPISRNKGMPSLANGIR